MDEIHSVMVLDFAHKRKTGDASSSAKAIVCSQHGSGYLSSRALLVHTSAMDELERLRELVGLEADGWTKAQLEQLRRDIETIASLLLDLYRSRTEHMQIDKCGSPNVDVLNPDR